jgi:chemotaxis protein methyltransferase CheR
MALSSANFEYVRTLLRRRSGQCLDYDKSYLVETRLLSLARRHGFSSVEELLSRLRSKGEERLLGELVEAMTINETSFFRDGHAFEVLRQSVLPALIQRRSAVRRLNVWSAACSSGQEPYSVAILLRHSFPALSGWTIRLLASDLSTAMLDRASQGRYSDMEVSRGLPADLRDAYFQKKDDCWHIRDDLRRMVEFRRVNLGSAWPDLPPLDLVLLRNVLIYFDIPTRQQILDRFRRAMQPDDYLMLGGAETTHNLDDKFVPVSFGQVSFFQLRDEVV